eukprot:CAMPEP_0113707888 /NCGR_PEP_ID=MMETSP0038_2-20120614/28662_1 /TAXON_ID=2898 /ORGANISM="Cryptomonas paramecium" /LENGTH=62 /DNA_ID=CAMNT_0000633505 /DNA_START=611 /DNA_END=794 /DNA_ORIENTATION=+ /assembly_acc=CAM_ASM_000170
MTESPRLLYVLTCARDASAHSFTFAAEKHVGNGSLGEELVQLLHRVTLELMLDLSDLGRVLS